MDQFHNAESEACKGTLSHIKNMFGHHKLKTKVKDDFQHAWDLMEVIQCA